MTKFWMGGLGVVVCLAGGFSVWKFGVQAGDGHAPSGTLAEPAPDHAAELFINEPIQPIPTPENLDPRRVALGKRLFYDAGLSRDHSISCASCHDVQKGGADHMARSRGIDGQLSDIACPTVLNSAFNFKQFWDGRADTLEDQVQGPILNPKEMGSNWSDVLARLGQDATYVAAFGEIFPSGISADAVKSSIATFERSLTTPNGRFDRFLRGDAAAITESEKRGYVIFKERGCVRCHQGVNVGGNMFSKFGVLGDYFGDRGNVTRADFGRWNVTGKETDRFVFKVPTLRNVSQTAPYFHDGSAATLEDAVSVMARYQLGSDPSKEDIDLIVAFLKTLSSEEGMR